jgi:hypothetical protein
MQFHCWVFTVTENKNSVLHQEDGLVRQLLTCGKEMPTLVNGKYVLFSHHPHLILILKNTK